MANYSIHSIRAALNQNNFNSFNIIYELYNTTENFDLMSKFFAKIIKDNELYRNILENYYINVPIDFNLQTITNFDSYMEKLKLYINEINVTMQKGDMKLAALKYRNACILSSFALDYFAYKGSINNFREVYIELYKNSIVDKEAYEILNTSVAGNSDIVLLIVRCLK